MGPDFELGLANELSYLDTECIWDGGMTRELQVAISLDIISPGTPFISFHFILSHFISFHLQTVLCFVHSSVHLLSAYDTDLFTWCFTS